MVFYDGSIYWLADGFHRYAAAQRNGFLDIDVEIRQGTREDAIDFACSDEPNGKHGLRETKEDRERRVLTMVKKHPDWSVRQIESHCGVSKSAVERYRQDICPTGTDEAPPDRTVTRGDTTYTMKVAKIGKREGGREMPAPELSHTIGD